MRPSPTTITNELTVKTLRRITGVQRRRILSSTSIFEISAISQNFCGRKISAGAKFPVRSIARAKQARQAVRCPPAPATQTCLITDANRTAGATRFATGMQTLSVELTPEDRRFPERQPECVTPKPVERHLRRQK